MTISAKGNEISISRLLAFTGIVFFLYSLIASISIQLYIVPKIFPEFDLGDGLVILDSSGFNQLAKAKALDIEKEGWGAWELRPQNMSPVGIASIFYALWTPKPLSLLPLNSFVHAMSGCLVLWLLSHLFSNRSAIVGSTLFVVNPAAMEWVAHIHRDGIFILGNLLVLVCIVQLYRGLNVFNVMTMTWGLLGGVLGTCLVWVARSYWVPVLLVFVMCGILFVSIVFFLTQHVSQSNFVQFLCFIVFSISCVLFQMWLIKHYGFKFTELPQKEFSIKLEKSLNELNRDNGNDLSRAMPSADGIIALSWERSSWLPYEVEAKFYQMARARQGFLWTGGNTIIDTDVTLDSVADFFMYFPRALQVGLLSPFPELWQGVGSTPSMTLARKIIGVATLVYYACLMSALMGVLSHRRVPILWLILLFSLMGVLAWTYICPNIGTLLRLRAGFYMLLITFGAANMVEMASVWLRKRQRQEITHYL